MCACVQQVRFRVPDADVHHILGFDSGCCACLLYSNDHYDDKLIMAHQSPMISIPKKSTEEVDWTGPIRSLIAQSYGESPDNYAAECASLQRTRQDAVRGAGSDFTGNISLPYASGIELNRPHSSRPVVQILRAARIARTAVL